MVPGTSTDFPLTDVAMGRTAMLALQGVNAELAVLISYRGISASVGHDDFWLTDLQVSWVNAALMGRRYARRKFGLV